MRIQFILMVNKQGQTRLAQYYGKSLSVQEKAAIEVRSRAFKCAPFPSAHFADVFLRPISG